MQRQKTVGGTWGSKPSNFQLSLLHARGVEKKSAASLSMVNESLFYLSREGVMCCDGGLPAAVGQNLSPLRLTQGVGAGYMGKYYLSAEDQNGDPQFLVYDDARCLWHREDDTAAAFTIAMYSIPAADKANM